MLMYENIKVYKSIFKKWIFSCLLPDEKMCWITQAISQAINSSSLQLPFSSTASLKTKVNVRKNRAEFFSINL